MNSISTLFQHWADENANQIIQLQNKDRVPVAALYLNSIKFDTIAICETSRVSEKYYLYLNGIAIFFTYYRKIEKENEIINGEN